MKDILSQPKQDEQGTALDDNEVSPASFETPRELKIRNFVVFSFFFLCIAVAFALGAHAIDPARHWNLYTAIGWGLLYGLWLFDKFRHRG